jgi:hypothetical protein
VRLLINHPVFQLLSIQETAEKIQVKYVETSAKMGDTVETMFATLVQGILEGGGGDSQDISGAAVAGGDIIKVSAATHKAAPRKRGGCCAKKTN